MAWYHRIIPVSRAELARALELERRNYTMLNESLKTAITRIINDVSVEIKAVAAKLSADEITDADITDSVNKLNAAADTLEAETALLTPALAPTATMPSSVGQNQINVVETSVDPSRVSDKVVG